MLPLYKPTLYACDPQGNPVLLGGRCECGYVFFPLQAYGCERCGRHGSALSPHILNASGTLLASAVVQLHADKKRTVPFVVGTIALDQGPVVRTLLTGILPTSKRLPMRVTGTLVEIEQGDPPRPALDLRFVVDDEQRLT